ncbi:MAG: glycosyltransferase [Muribaculaceae bacterium]|nr:glycosyltransferase [Muribaculaceae bacterium]
MVNELYFSVIICLYNCEIFFDRGIKCLLNQTFKDFELILVDDGSTDSTFQLCDKMAVSYPNVKVIHQSNSGLGAARNRGIEVTKGKYICFFDIDDEVGNDWLNNIYEELNDFSADLLIYGYEERNLKYRSSNIFRFGRGIIEDKKGLAKEFVQTLSGIKFNNGFAWNKVYRRDFILEHSLKFPNDAIQQDEIFNHNVYQCFPKILISDKILYHYYIFDKGNIRKRFIPQRITIFENVKKSFIEIDNTFEIKDDKLKKYIHLRFLRNVLFNRNPFERFNERKNFYRILIANPEVADSVAFLKKNNIEVQSIHDIFFSLYCHGVRKKSILVLIIVDYLYRGLNKVANLTHK